MSYSLNIDLKVMLINWEEKGSYYLYKLVEFPNTKNEIVAIGNKEEDLKIGGLHSVNMKLTTKNRVLFDKQDAEYKKVWINDTKVFINSLVPATADEL